MSGRNADYWQRRADSFDANPDPHVAREVERLARCKREAALVQPLKTVTGAKSLTRTRTGRVRAHFADGSRRDVTALASKVSALRRNGSGGRPCARRREHAPTRRRAGASSRTSSSDPGEPEPPAAAWRWAHPASWREFARGAVVS